MANNKSIQVLRGSNTYNPSTSEELLLDGQPFYSKKDGKLRIGIKDKKIKELDDVAALNLDREIGSVSQKDFIYTGNSIVFSDGTKGAQNGDTIPGAIASGEGAVALGGLRYDYYTSPETHAYNLTIKPTVTENWGRTPTSAEGNQSFAAGGSSHAYGNWSVAMGKDAKAYQLSSVSLGGSTVAGETLEEFNSKHGSGGVDSYGLTYDKSYSFAFAANEGTQAKGRASSAFGKNTVAGFERQFVIGKFNDNKPGNIFEVGIGDNNNRLNGFSITDDGIFKFQHGPNVTSGYASEISNSLKIGGYLNCGNLTAGLITSNQGLRIFNNGSTSGFSSYIMGPIYQADTDGTAIVNKYKDSNNIVNYDNISSLNYWGKLNVSGYISIGNKLKLGTWDTSVYTDDSVFVVGGGSAWNKRSNAMTIDKKGNIETQGFLAFNLDGNNNIVAENLPRLIKYKNGPLTVENTDVQINKNLTISETTWGGGEATFNSDLILPHIEIPETNTATNQYFNIMLLDSSTGKVWKSGDMTTNNEIGGVYITKTGSIESQAPINLKSTLYVSDGEIYIKDGNRQEYEWFLDSDHKLGSSTSSYLTEISIAGQTTSFLPPAAKKLHNGSAFYSVGDAYTPCYFEDGIPIACNFTVVDMDI